MPWYLIVDITKCRADLRNAYLQDEPCKLPIPLNWTYEADSVFRRNCQIVEAASMPEYLQSGEVQAYLRLVIQDILQFVSTCSHSTKSEILNASVNVGRLKLPYWVNVVIHRLLCFRPMKPFARDDPTTAVVMEESLRLALLLYLAQIWMFCK